MIQIGRFKFGFAAASMIVVFIALSACAVVSSYTQYSPMSSMPLSDIIIINESLALAVTLGYGVIVHLVMALIKRFK